MSWLRNKTAIEDGADKLSIKHLFMTNEIFSRSDKLEEFHLIQDLALDGNIELAALKLSALLDSKPWEKSSVPEDWWDYLRATLAYLEGNQAALENFIYKCGINKNVVERLQNGLSRMGTVDYRRDYIVE